MDVFLPVAGLHVNAMGIIVMGLVVGFLSGLLGVGGGSLLTPMLNIAFGVPYNVAIGSDLSQLVGSSTAATVRHGSFGNIDFRLGLLMLLGSAAGIEVGAQLLTLIVKLQSVTLWGHTFSLLDALLNGFYTLLLGWIASLVMLEALQTRRRETNSELAFEPTTTLGDRLREIRWGPQVALPRSGIPRISLWVVLGIGFITGILSGFLGIGGGFIRLPAMIYLIGCPTLVAVGTDLFEIMLSSAYGAASHGAKGNVDLILVCLLISGSTIGSSLGATMTRYIAATTIRVVFALVSCVGTIVVGYKLITVFW